MKIMNLKAYEKGCTWTVEFGDDDVEYTTFGAKGNKAEYRTNRYGEGLWIWNEDRGEWIQKLGTEQFSLQQKTTSGIRAAIKRQFKIF